MRICVIGTGYVGIVSGACFAELGHQVACIDINQEKVKALRRCESPIFEHGLDDLLKRHMGGKLTASTDLRAAVRDSEMTFITVGTPFDGKSIDTSYVQAAAREIGAVLAEMDAYHVVVVKSTVVPGTTDQVVKPILEAASGKKCGEHFGLCMNPEFLSEGTAVEDFMHPDRLVFGGIDDRSNDRLEELYAAFPASVPRLRTNTRTAEMIKYASNALLANLISFSNEIANLGARIGKIDANEVMRGVHLSQYFGERNAEGLPAITAFLKAGCGFGGSCLPKDVNALIVHGRENGLELNLLKSVIEVNRGQPDEIMRLIGRHFASLENVPVAVLGLAFKPDTDDIRESPAFPIIRKLKASSARVVAYDPIARPTDHPDMIGVTLASSLSEAIAAAEVVVLVTRWAEFSQLADVLDQLGRRPLVVDGRRVLDPPAFVRYEGIGY